MRRLINSVNKNNSTKYERRFLELLKKNHIPFISKVKVKGREIDFLCGKYAIDVDGHKQDGTKNHLLVVAGYIPVHYLNSEISEDLNINYLKDDFN